MLSVSHKIISNMEERTSRLYPHIEEHLKERYLFLPGDCNVVLTSRKFLTQNGSEEGIQVGVYSRFCAKSPFFLCGWGELPDSRVFISDFGVLNEVEALKNIKEYISSHRKIQKYSEGSLYLERLRNKGLHTEIGILQQEIERLKQKKRELKYRPGGYGALKARQHFENILK
ncbi:hypothetical protein A9K97_gp426 [Tokyovirus A1]|uniref:hypothetical protein n=1 Tax=Tokyovirus A1 TaxID=1826170 RepID=UPI0007A97CBE|nr:hypothetical protein A9K97_gp426 [Tokyovirus A1]BAU79925.1 hypothetical protein [Tokyovirus A1]